MAKQLVSEFEARRVERMLRALWPGLLAANETLTVQSGTLEAGWLAMRWELADAARLHVYPVEVRVDLAKQKLREQQAIELVYDFLGAEFDGYFRLGREPFTGPKWEAVEFAGKELFCRGQLRAEAVELRATALLDADRLGREPPADR